MVQVQFGNLSSTGANTSPFVSVPPTTTGSPGAAIAQQAFTPQATPAPSTPTFTGNGNAYANQVLAPGLNSPHTSAAASAALANLRTGLANTQFGGEAPKVTSTAVTARQENATSSGFAGQVFSGGASTT